MFVKSKYGLKNIAYGLIAMAFILSVCSCKQVWHISDMHSRTHLINTLYDQSLGTQDSTERTIAPYRAKIKDEMERIIGVSENNMPKAKPESALTNWFGDMFYRQAVRISGESIDFAFSNYGGIRLNEIPKGAISVGLIYELMPFDNHLVIVDIPGHIVIEMFDIFAKTNGGWPVSEQIMATFSKNTLQNLTINGQEVDPERIYKVATSNFLAEGGDKLEFLIPVRRQDYPVWIRDMMIFDIEESTKKGEEVKSVTAGRMQFID
jgi:2',3'-cyclic-nucleotide 2'-phosphodiesterase (5'-nucleotidase family)